ncbi:hypothetical protein EGW08_016684 [Elysia chlorotica]|uniref:Uncharacterized protein n=1 Tax=Elysia chlorotica TaxID=188477 RepID=A0A3S0ZC91_ELYCH|nr:hypothetical protein EGW08_016684 [Elysia chlorotica]
MEHDQDLELDDERTELREDEKKLQIALQEYDDDWDVASDEDDDEDESRFLIDLEKEGYETPAAAQSVNSGTSSIGSASHCHRKSIDVDDDRSYETGGRQGLVSSLPPSFEGADLGSKSTSVADPEKTLALNRALQGILEGHIEAIQDAIASNKDQQERLEEDVSNPKKRSKSRTTPFRAPYFRVGNEFPEPNEDMIAKRQFSQIRSNGTLGATKDLRYFQTRSKSTLRKYVLQDALEQMIRPLMSKMEAEIERCDLAKSRVEEQECQLELERPKLQAITDPKARMKHKFLIAELEEGIREQR